MYKNLVANLNPIDDPEWIDKNWNKLKLSFNNDEDFINYHLLVQFK